MEKKTEYTIKIILSLLAIISLVLSIYKIYLENLWEPQSPISIIITENSRETSSDSPITQQPTVTPVVINNNVIVETQTVTRQHSLDDTTLIEPWVQNIVEVAVTIASSLRDKQRNQKTLEIAQKNDRPEQALLFSSSIQRQEESIKNDLNKYCQLFTKLINFDKDSVYNSFRSYEATLLQSNDKRANVVPVSLRHYATFIETGCQSSLQWESDFSTIQSF